MRARPGFRSWLRLRLLAPAGLALLLGACEAPRTFQYTPVPQPQAMQPLLAPPGLMPPPVQTEAPPPASEPSVVLTPPPAEPGGPKVALLLPLSGRDAALGQQLLEAAELALFDMADERFDLMPLDTGGTPAGAAAAAERAVAEGARMILGPLFGAEAQAVAPVARRAGINVVTFSNDQAVAGDGVFVFGFLPRPQIDRLIAYAASKDLKRFAVLAPRGSFGDTVADEARKAAQLARVQVTRSETYDPAAPDISPTARRFADIDRRAAALAAERKLYEGKTDEVSRAALKRLEGLQGLGDLPYDAVLLPEGGDRLRALAPMLQAYEVDARTVRLLGTALWDDLALASEPSLRGAWFVAPPPDARLDFEAAYEKSFRRKPPRLATLSYDLVALAAVLAGSDEPQPFGREALVRPTGFAGVDGLFRFLPDGRTERGYAILEIGDRRRVVIDPAPQSFESLTN